MENQFIGYLELKSYPYISTTGDYQQVFIYEGIRYHHILDAETGWPSEDYRSVTILSKNSAFEADLLSTAVFAGGYPDGLKILERFSGAEAIAVIKSGEVITTSPLKGEVQKLIKKL